MIPQILFVLNAECAFYQAYHMKVLTFNKTFVNILLMLLKVIAFKRLYQKVGIYVISFISIISSCGTWHHISRVDYGRYASFDV